MGGTKDTREPAGKDEQNHGPAGPHDRPELRNEDATPGAGTLPENTPDGEADAGAG